MYIPETITVGFQARKDTYTGKLGYVIYTDHTGVLRKEKSWQSWRSKDIEPVTFENKPTTGFTFNKGVQRNGYWGSGRSVIRVWDPRDFEFEISITNLVGILMHSDVSKRDVQEPCVFAWAGTELVLLPVNSEEYQEAQRHTAKQKVNFSAKDLVVGHTYELKKTNRQVIYLGYLPRYTIDATSSNSGEQQVYASKKTGKKHVFAYSIDSFDTLDPKQIAHEVSAEVHENFAALMDAYYGTRESQPVKEIVFEPMSESSYDVAAHWIEKISDTEYFLIDWRGYYCKDVCVGGNTIETRHRTTNVFRWGGNSPKDLKFVALNEKLKSLCGEIQHDSQGDLLSLSEIIRRKNQGSDVNYVDKIWEEARRYRPATLLNQLGSMGLGHLFYVLADGKRIPF